MNVEIIKLVLPLLVPVFSLLGTSILFLKKFVKNKKINKVLEQAEEVTKQIIPYVMEAEKFINYTGEEKKKYVMTKLNQFAITNNIKFEEEETSNKIEELVKLTKQVNIKSCPIIVNNEEIKNNIKNESIEIQIQNILDGLAR